MKLLVSPNPHIHSKWSTRSLMTDVVIGCMCGLFLNLINSKAQL